MFSLPDAHVQCIYTLLSSTDSLGLGNLVAMLFDMAPAGLLQDGIVISKSIFYWYSVPMCARLCGLFE